MSPTWMFGRSLFEECGVMYELGSMAVGSSLDAGGT